MATFLYSPFPPFKQIFHTPAEIAAALDEGWADEPFSEEAKALAQAAVGTAKLEPVAEPVVEEKPALVPIAEGDALPNTAPAVEPAVEEAVDIDKEFDSLV